MEKLDWTLDWTGLDWTGLDWTGLDSGVIFFRVGGGGGCIIQFYSP